MEKGKKDKHIGFRADPELAAQLQRWAEDEEISVADLVRKLTRISAKIYRHAGSLRELRDWVEAEFKGVETASAKKKGA